MTATEDTPDFPSFPDGLLEFGAELGAVTDRSVRVWLRMPETTRATGTLQLENGQTITAHTWLSEYTDWTGVLVFELEAPAPRRRFTCQVGPRSLSGRLAPSPGVRTGLTFAFGSCNEPFEDRDGQIAYHEARQLYDALLEDIERSKSEFLVLGGDQIYSDFLDLADVRKALEDADHSETSYAAALARYRLITRAYLQARGFRQLRERVPTYCIWDDHDIFDNWGSQQWESDIDRLLFRAAARTYCEYQHARNPGGRIEDPPYNYTFQYGDVSFLVLDVRGCRDWTSGQLLGKRQWMEIVEYLSSSEAESLSTLFIVTTIPVAHVSRWFTMLLSRAPVETANAVRDRWTADGYVQQRDELLSALFIWQRARQGRQVFILSGDVHVASAFTIREREGTGVIHQFTSSAFTTPLIRYQRYVNHIAARGSNLFEPRWRFTRHFMHAHNNAGLVRLTPLETGGHIVELLIRGWDREKRRLRTSAKLQFRPDAAG